MTGRFPGADSVEEFWKNLCDGVESITFLDRSELEPSEQIVAAQNESYVAARPLLKNPEMFDAEFLASIPRKPRRWIRSIAFCSNAPGKCWSARDTIPHTRGRLWASLPDAA